MRNPDREHDRRQERAGYEPRAGTAVARREGADLQNAGGAQPDERSASQQCKHAASLDPGLPAPDTARDRLDRHGRAHLGAIDASDVARVGRDPAQNGWTAGRSPSLTPHHALIVTRRLVLQPALPAAEAAETRRQTGAPAFADAVAVPGHEW